MPQASQKLRDEWNGPSEETAIKYLEAKGFVQQRNWCWLRPSPTYEMTEKDWSAIQFLCDEWDMGGLVE